LTSFVGLAAFGIGMAMGIFAIFVAVALSVHFVAILKGLNGSRLTLPGITALTDRFTIRL
jgi:hypothetical protein